MQTEHYTKILDALTEWHFGIHQNASKPGRKVCGRPRKEDSDYEPGIPLNPHPVVTSVKTIERPCEWCDGTCTKQKSFKRSIGSNIWQAKCEDCGENRNIPTGKINTDK